MKFLPDKISFFSLAIFLLINYGCSVTEQPQLPSQNNFQNVLSKIRLVTSSIVGVNATFTYEVETYRYIFLDGKPIRSFTSPTGYRLLPGDSGIVQTEFEHSTQGCGTIIMIDKNTGLILTSYHILTSKDTLTGYYQDEHGRNSNLISYRAVKKKTKYFIIDQQNNLKNAAVLYANEQSDLGLLITNTSAALGSEFPFSFDYEQLPDWGEPVYVFGYPQSIKQLTTAIVSPLTYQGYFSLDAVSRIGFSGGPVIAVTPDAGLSLIGIVRSIPATKIRYISPPTDIPLGVHLIPEDLPRSTIQENDIIDNRAAYAVNMKRIGIFLQECIPILQKHQIVLPQRIVPSEK
ncbi:MAG: trypsin-like peptidase domain-containing protein [Bacteroidetes bacterium]|nr:trypsin-like peptidase domain-containing protein [Bacteroidota bacterium]